MVGLYYSASILAGRASAPYVSPLVHVRFRAVACYAALHLDPEHQHVYGFIDTNIKPFSRLSVCTGEKPRLRYCQASRA
jgi:hypothetical protein